MTVLRKRSQMAKLEFFSICVFYYYKPQMWTLQWLWGRGDGVMA